MILQLKIIFLQIFFLSLIDEILNKLLDQLNINRISGIRPYQISSKAIQYRADIKKGIIWPDFRCVFIHNYYFRMNGVDRVDQPWQSLLDLEYLLMAYIIEPEENPQIPRERQST
jgi:hypothetical protein